MINSLLPVAGVGGDIVGARLASAGRSGRAGGGQHGRRHHGRRGDPARLRPRRGGAARRPDERDEALEAACAVLVGVAVFAASIGAFVLVSITACLARSSGWLTASRRRKGLSGLRGAPAIDEAVVATYRRRASLLRASLLRLIGWAAGAGEIWLVMHFLEQAPQPDRRVHPGKPEFRRPRRGFHGAGSVRRARGRRSFCSARCSDCPRTWRWRFPCPNGSANWPWACRASWPAVGRRAPSPRPRRGCASLTVLRDAARKALRY